MKQTARKYLKPLKPIKLGNVSKQLNITSNSGIELPVYASNGIDRNSNKELSIFSHDSKHLKSMKESCKYAAEILNYACDLVKPGITTNFIDVKVFDYCVNVLKVYPSPLNYRTFPKTLCTSVNEVLCHGIPDDRELLDGDIVNLDVSAYKNGHHGDTSRTVSVGEVGKDVQSLCDTTRLALHEAIKICKPGMRLLEIAQICDSIASESGFSVDPVFCGHGIGTTFHMEPLVRHSMAALNQGRFSFEALDEFKLVEGLVFTIEPILVAGDTGNTRLQDGWTEVSSSGALSAQYEETILITKHGAEILTKV